MFTINKAYENCKYRQYWKKCPAGFEKSHCMLLPKRVTFFIKCKNEPYCIVIKFAFTKLLFGSNLI